MNANHSVRRQVACLVLTLGVLGVPQRGPCGDPAPADARLPAAPPALRASTLLRAAELQADAALLRRAFEMLHPGLYRYNTPSQMDAAFRELDLEFQQDRTLAQAYVALSVLAAKVKCGHTYLNFFNQSEAVAAALLQAPRLPFYFRWLGDRMIVTRSFAADLRIRPGTEVFEVNDIPVATILAKLMSVARADGSNDAKRIDYLQVGGGSRYEAFDVYWPLFFPPASASVTLRIRALGSAETETATLPLVAYADRQAAIAADAPASPTADAPLWEFRLLEDGLAYLRMPSWVLWNTNWDWQRWRDETFATLLSSSATDLVIDLRGNEGGSDVGEVLVSHLISAPVPRPLGSRLVRYRAVPDDLRPYLDAWDPSFADWGAAAIDSTGGFYRLRRDGDDESGAVIMPASPRLPGRVWVLVGATNSSATFEFAQMVRQNRLGLLVGQPTGGNQRGINGGCFFFLRLPRTGLEVDLPLIGFFYAGDPPDAGPEPDIRVVPTASDIAEGRDAELEAVRARARRQPESP